MRHLECLGNIYVRPPFATDKNDFYFDRGAVGPGDVVRFFGVFLRSPGTWSTPSTPLPSTRLTMLKREERKGAFLLFQLRGQRKKTKHGENIFSTS